MVVSCQGHDSIVTHSISIRLFSHGHIPFATFSGCLGWSSCGNLAVACVLARVMEHLLPTLVLWFSWFIVIHVLVACYLSSVSSLDYSQVSVAVSCEHQRCSQHALAMPRQSKQARASSASSSHRPKKQRAGALSSLVDDAAAPLRLGPRSR